MFGYLIVAVAAPSDARNDGCFDAGDYDDDDFLEVRSLQYEVPLSSDV